MAGLAELKQRITARDATIAVIGMGYVGLPLALVFAEKGFKVLGFDIDTAKIDDLKRGRSYISHIATSRVAAMHDSGRIDATADFSRLSEADAILICVPTPLGPESVPDLTFVIETTRTVARYLRSGQLVVLESTTYPGTTTEVVKPLLQDTSLVSGSDFLLAYSPEREDPGNSEFSTERISKVVGGDGALALEIAGLLYGQIVPRVVAVSSTATAEAAKLTENVFRAVNIALVNELKVIYGKMGIDIWEVIEAAKTKPFGYMPFYPGPGLGGHCIPIDPYYLAWKARQHGATTRFIELAGEINTAMPGLVVETLAAALSERFDKSLDGAEVLLIGVAYKKNVEDTRESPAFALWDILEAHRARVSYHDPHVPLIPSTREHMQLAGKTSIELSADNVGCFDAVLICTDHDAIDFAAIVRHARLVVDTRNSAHEIVDGQEKVVKA